MTKLLSLRLNRDEIARIENSFNTRLKLAALTVSGEMTRLTTLRDGTMGIAERLNPKHYSKVLRRKPSRRSSPGESPYRQTGRLSQTMQVELFPRRFVAHIGPEQFYGSILEKKLNRPHIRLALINKTPDVIRILST